ncbi:FAD-binding oxidoreductase [Candidatus Venteria ishoeyi]|uniref:FAD-binding oxidoreductase n=1 Tax=Candidatus Venteria ishoeyi TaxID=1899563 RepID=UPI0025A60F33|nr:FAD-binding oxidoreductase [Candidatus Venteria ishoeyi]MDM8545129.1 FAD-binding oxidoreductase [Candidatus Venteria ishoeyi]
MSEKQIEQSLSAVVRASSRITDDSTDEVRELVIYIDEPSFRYRVGQSIDVIVPGKGEFGSGKHIRRYTIAKGNHPESEQGVELTLLVRRCFYIDDVSGEQYPGKASNYLCDAKVGDTVSVTGPYRSVFNIPTDKNANILMIGTGTGIAPFRSFIEAIYKQEGEWNGKVRLFYGVKTGLDLLYMNDKNNDLTNYYHQDTFNAYSALADKPLSGEEVGLEKSLKNNQQEVWDLINLPDTYVFIAGLAKISSSLDTVMTQAAGSEQNWEALKQKLKDEKRLSKLLYD